MTRNISLSLSILSVTAVGWAAACSSTPSNNAGSSSTVSSTQSGSTSSTAGSSTSASSTSTGPLLIDDQSSPSGNQISWKGAPSGDAAGYWYTYLGGGEAGDQGTITPTPQSAITDGGTAAYAFTAIGGASAIPAIVSDAGVDTSTFTHAACVQGTTPSTEYSYGAEGFYFAGVTSGTGDASTNTKTAVDISKHTGISFWIYNGQSTPLSLSVQISDKESQPDSGICGLDGSADEACNSPAIYSGNPNGTTVPPGWSFIQTDFTLYQVQAYYGYGDMNTMAAPSRLLDTTAAYDVQWQVNQRTAGPDAGTLGGPPVSFNFCVADVAFY